MEDENNVNIDTTNDEVEIDLELSEDTTEEETPEVDVAQMQATNKKLYERAKKAEAELKALRVTTPQPNKPAQVSPQPNIEEVVLQANGMSDELLNELKAVAKARNITSLIKAQTDPLFVAMKEKIEQDKKQKAIGMQASRGSGSVKAQKTFNTPGLSREEHKKLIENLK